MSAVEIQDVVSLDTSNSIGYVPNRVRMASRILWPMSSRLGLWLKSCLLTRSITTLLVGPGSGTEWRLHLMIFIKLIVDIVVIDIDPIDTHLALFEWQLCNREYTSCGECLFPTCLKRSLYSP